MSDNNKEMDYLAKDLVVCKYYKDGWKKKKDELLRHLQQEKTLR